MKKATRYLIALAVLAALIIIVLIILLNKDPKDPSDERKTGTETQEAETLEPEILPLPTEDPAGSDPAYQEDMEPEHGAQDNPAVNPDQGTPANPDPEAPEDTGGDADPQEYQDNEGSMMTDF